MKIKDEKVVIICLWVQGNLRQCLHWCRKIVEVLQVILSRCRGSSVGVESIFVLNREGVEMQRQGSIVLIHWVRRECRLLPSFCLWQWGGQDIRLTFFDWVLSRFECFTLRLNRLFRSYSRALCVYGQVQNVLRHQVEHCRLSRRVFQDLWSVSGVR